MKWFFITPSGGKYGPFDTREKAEISATEWAETILSRIKVVEE